MQAYLDKLPGVIETVVGYANGTTEAPTYEEVCSGTTHHAETVHVTYDPKVIGLPLLLAAYLDVIDPTSVNKQGEDEGEQYRTGIWWTDDADEAVVTAALEQAASALGEDAGPRGRAGRQRPGLLARGGVPPEVPGQGPLWLLPRRPGRRRPLCGRAPGGVRPGRAAR